MLVRSLYADGITGCIVLVVEEDGDLIELETADGDRGRVIGRQGRVAKALRAILNATADGAGSRLDIVD